MGGVIFNFILLAVFSLFLAMSMNIKDLRIVDPLGASGFPKFILMILVLLLLISSIKSVKEFLSNKENMNSQRVPSKSTFLIIGLITLVALYTISLNTIGFLLATVLLIPAVLLLLGEKRKTLILLLTLITPVLFTVLFGVILKIPLPGGTGIFLEISRLLY